MKKVFFLFFALMTMQLVHAQGLDKVTAKFPKVVCLPLEFKYLGEFRLPNNQVEIRWKVIGQIKNTGNATYHSTQPGFSSKLSLFVTNNIPNADDFFKQTAFNTLAVGEIKKLELDVKYIKGQTKPEIDSIFFDGTEIQCIERKFVPTWIPTN